MSKCERTFVRRSIHVAINADVALRNSKSYVPSAIENAFPNSAADVGVNTIGYRKCNNVQSSVRLFWRGVPVRTMFTLSADIL